MPFYNIYRVEGPQASVILAPAGANNDILVTAKAPGSGGNALTVTIVVSGLNTVLSVTRAGNAITVNSATDGAGLATSTATQVIEALNSDPDSRDLVTAANAPANNGSGVVAALSAQSLTGGDDIAVGVPQSLTYITTIHALNDEDAVMKGAPSAAVHVAIPEVEVRNKWRTIGAPPYTYATVVQS